MVEALKIFLIGLLFWRVLIIFYKPRYLQFEGQREKLFRIEFGNRTHVLISRVFLWQTLTLFGTFTLVYVIHLESQEWRYTSFQSSTPKVKNLGDGWIVRKGGYVLRKHPMNALIRSNMVKNDPIPSGTKLTILDTLDRKKWFKVKFNEYEGYVSGAAIIEETEAEKLVKSFIENLDYDKRSACEQLIRWKGKCDEGNQAFFRSPLYGGVTYTYFSDRDVNLVSVANGRVVVNAEYEARYDPYSYFKLRRTCLYQYSGNRTIGETRQVIIRNDYKIGFRYNEDFYIMKLNNDSLKIWDHVLQDKECVPERLPLNGY